MKKSSKKKEEKLEKKSKPGKGSAEHVEFSIGIAGRIILVVIVFGLGYIFAASGVFHSDVEKKMNIFLRTVLFFLAQATATDLFVTLFLQIGRRINGESGETSWGPTEEESTVNDCTRPWPPAELLSPELKKFATLRGQPFFLNHVTGRRRCKDACMRVGMNVASLLTVAFMCYYIDNRTLGSLGLVLDWRFCSETLVGLVVGVSIVSFMFLVELYAGWLHFLQFFEVFDRSENFAVCIFWDVVFHLNVSLNEELPVRGWMLYNIAEACARYLEMSPAVAFIVAMVVQSSFFVAMHLTSPGGMQLKSMLNIFIGGIAGGLNVLLTGGRLGFALGWHFGWNISMGNVYGLSTSGIPISATFVSVAPHPEKKDQHGGVFGPEGGVVSPFAYSLGILLLIATYGVSDVMPIELFTS
eukprot:TRINITY_DN61421_c0_g1_i1.p1 TRINITY_DN61421_c0_g1~~TRINITY_DN61421_c0_g1_i1.p1  ORF type:complete len:413 (+),score=71.09 TRINITY_DN61421_c0_g1_i1:74-1312(+)